MATLNELVQELDATFAYYKTRGIRFGRMGKLQSDGSITLQSGLTDKNLVWVTLNDQTREVIAAICLRVKKQINLPVVVAPNEYNKLEVIGVDSSPAMDIYGEGTPTFYTPDGVGEWRNEIVADKNTLPRVYPAEAGGLLITISPFLYDNALWGGGDLDLTSFRPATASRKAWVIVCVNTSTNAATAVTGAEYSLAYTLTLSELAADLDSVTAGLYPVWAFVLANGQTTIAANNQNEPVRFKNGRPSYDWIFPTLRLKPSTTLTIASGVITRTQAYHILAAETGTSDTLTTINGGSAGDRLVLQADTGDTITLDDGADNIQLNGNADYALSGDRTIELFFDGSNWSDLSPNDGGSASGVTVKEVDGTPNVANVSTIRFTNGSVTDDGGNQVSIDLGVAAGDSTNSVAYASRPAAGNTGNLFFPTDGHSIQRDNGSAWLPWGPLFAFTQPDAVASWTWVNQGGASASDSRAGIYLTAPSGAGENIRALVQAAPSTPYVITAAFLPLLYPADFANCGIGWRESGTGELVIARMVHDGSVTGGMSLVIAKLDSPTALNSNYVTVDMATYRAPIVWLRIADDTTNRIVSLSADGQNWMQIHSVGRTDFLTADQVLFCASAGNTSGPAAMTLLSWLEA